MCDEAGQVLFPPTSQCRDKSPGPKRRLGRAWGERARLHLALSHVDLHFPLSAWVNRVCVGPSLRTEESGGLKNTVKMKVGCLWRDRGI